MEIDTGDQGAFCLSNQQLSRSSLFKAKSELFELWEPHMCSISRPESEMKSDKGAAFLSKTDEDWPRS